MFRIALRSIPCALVAPLAPLALLAISCGGAPPAALEAREAPPPPEAVAAARAPLGAEAVRADLPRSSATRIVSSRDEEEFGGPQYGFGWWMSLDGQLIALYRFEGDVTPTFGQHGEADREPLLEVFDLRTNNIQHYDEFIAADPRARMAVFRESDHLWLLQYDSTTREDLTVRFADVEGDGNACMAARQVSFGALGDYVGWIRRNPDRAVVEEVGQAGSRNAFDVQTPRGRLWRIGVPSLNGWVLMQDIPRDTNRDRSIDWPGQDTSCVCLWCERFASSSGFHGWTGDAYKSFLAGPEGRIEVEGDVIPLGNSTYGDLENHIIRQAGGDTYALPEGCESVSFVHGVPMAIARCDGPSVLVSPETDGVMPLTDAVHLNAISTPARDGEGHHWISALVGTGDDQRLARLRIEDGRLEVGPRATAMAAARHYSGWMMFQTPSGVAALHVGEGRVRELEVPGVTGVESLFATIGRGGFIALSPSTGYAFRTPEKPYLTTSEGCALQPANSDGPLEQGPWRVRCPQED